MRYELSAQAERDIAAIARYTFKHFGRAQVDEYIDGLFTSFAILEDNPHMGRLHDSLKGVRRYTFRMHHVYYEARMEADVIRIAHIRHTAQQPPPMSAIRGR